MKAERWRSVVVALCCMSLSGCTTSRWVTESRQEVIPDSSVTQARPVLDVAQHSQERPELLVRLSKERTGPIELQEVKHEEIHKVWGIPPWKIIGGWLELGLSPALFVGETLNGTPGRGIGTIISGMMAATGFNPPRGWGWDLNERDVIGEDKTEVTPLRDGTQTIPWGSGPVGALYKLLTAPLNSNVTGTACATPGAHVATAASSPITTPNVLIPCRIMCSSAVPSQRPVSPALCVHSLSAV